MTQEMQVAIGFPAIILAGWLWIWLAIKYEEMTGEPFDDLIWGIIFAIIIIACVLALLVIWGYCCGKAFMQLLGII